MANHSPTPPDRIFAALSDPTRRAILARLEAEETLTVSDLARPLPMSLPSVMKHLDVLEGAGLIARQDGAQRRPPPDAGADGGRHGLARPLRALLDREPRSPGGRCGGRAMNAIAPSLARDGARTELWSRVTFGLRREGGTWRVAHRHASVPLDGSLRAAVDPTP